VYKTKGDIMKNNKTVAAILVGGLVLVMIAGAFTPGIVFAESETDQDDDPSNQGNRAGFLKFFDGLLARIFGYQKSMVAYLGRSLKYTEQAAERAQKRITELKVNGEDVTELEEALDTYYDLIAEAEQVQVLAESLVELHNGFDEDGLIDDLETARETVAEIEPNIKTVRDNIIEAAHVIYEAIQAYQEE
jgi:hypothetical protein